jgi:hypothetical protein
MTYVRHVGLKRVMHRFRYTTYIFNKALHMKNRDLISALLRSGTVRSDSRCEALIPRTAEKNRPHISPKTKAIVKQHINTTAARVVQRPA